MTITIAKAIEILTDALVGIEMIDDPDLPDAIQLGIEALRKIQEQRNPDGWIGSLKLPGETEEERGIIHENP